MASSFDRLKELDLSRDEVDRIGQALKNPEFRQLFAEYVEELQDPKNVETFEQEIKELEKERGNDVTFLHPKPGYVLKTSVGGDQKAFINICTNDNIQKPSSSPTVLEGSRGLHWSIPHSLSPPREDLDNKKARCKVFDVLFHPDTLHLATKNKAFRDIVDKTALEAVEKNFEVTLDKKNLKYPKMSYKGMPKASVIRRPSTQASAERTAEEQEFYDKIFANAPTNTPTSPRKTKKAPRRDSLDNGTVYTAPKFVIKHRSHVDIQDFTEHKDAKLNAAIPKELIVEINLPLLKSSSDINLDVTEKTVQLTSEKPAKYKLNLTLPYQVNESVGTAKFDKDLKKLVITLPVKRKTIYEYNRDDSGVESDFNTPGTPESEEEANGNSNKLMTEMEAASEHFENSVSSKSEKSIQFRTKFGGFLSEDCHYFLPEFSCHIFEDILAFTLHVKNVDENSVYKQFDDEGTSLAIKFTSISSTFFPSHYAFFAKFPKHKFDTEHVSIETWDNNVIVQLLLIPSKIELHSYFVGINENNMTEKFLEEPSILNQVLEKAVEEEKENKMCTEDGNRSHESARKKFQDRSNVAKYESPVESPKRVVENNFNFKNVTPPMGISNQSKSLPIDIRPSGKFSYESSGDELSCSSFSPRKSKGILKRRSLLGRSVSESSLDDFVCSSYEANCLKIVDSDIPEDEEVSTSLKKTVRFNDVVKKQLFRCNSSILGQKKKNQRKARNKKRTQDRRHSESETSDGDCKKEPDEESDEENGNEPDDHMLLFDSDH